MTTTHDLNNVPNAPTNEIPSRNGNDVSNSSSNNNPNHFIVLPNNNNNNNKNNEGSELSPTCVADVSAGSFPLASNRLLEPETPGWYARGADVDELLNEAYALDWLADSGDLDEDYSPAPEISPRAPHSATDALPPVVSGAPAPNGTDALPGLFDVASGNNNSGGSGSGSSNANGSTSNNSTGGTNNKSRTKLSTPNLFSSANGGSASSGNLVDENFNVFDSALDEQAFVSALLESNLV